MIEKLLNIKEEQRKAFKKHFLKGVLLELLVDHNIFENYCTLVNNKHFIEECKNLGYNSIKPMRNTNFTISIENEIPNATSTQEEIGIECNDEINNNHIQVLKNRIIFIEHSYETYENLRSKIEKILKILSSDTTFIKKIGFRKINSFIAKDVKLLSEITELFNNNLFSRLNEQFFTLETFNNYRDNFILSKNNTQQIINTSCSKIKGLENTYEIIIDNDIIFDEVTDVKKLYDNLDIINQMHFDVFCWSISDKLKNILNKV